MACTVHKDVWIPAGFEAKLAEMLESNRIEMVSKDMGSYYAASEKPEGYFLVWRKLKA